MTNTNPFSAGTIKRAIGAPRVLAVWALLGYTALFLFFSFFEWLLGSGSFSGRSAGAGFRSLFELAMPVIAVLLAVYVTPQLPWTKVITAVAVIEYVFALFFGIITLLIGVGAVLDNINAPGDVLNALRYLVLGVAGLALIAIAGYVSLRAYQSVGGRLPAAPTVPPTAPPAPPVA